MYKTNQKWNQNLAVSPCRIRLSQLMDGEVGAPDFADLALDDQLAERAERVCNRHLWIGPVQLVRSM